MNQEHLPRVPPHYGTALSYFFGFLASLILTLAAYFSVTQALFSGWVLKLVVAGLGLLQAWVQFGLFFHLTKESKPRWNLIVFLFTIMVTLILVFGSIWIMNNLNYNLMGSQ